jgi:hypothetical protein
VPRAPSGTAISSATIVAIRATCNDSERRTAISSATGRPVHIERPRSSVASPSIQVPNWTTSGRSRPSRWRSACSTAWLTAPPSAVSLISTMSPGMTRNTKKISAAVATSVGSMSRRRFSA